MSISRVENIALRSKIMTAQESSLLFKDGMVVGASGFTKGGDSKVVLKALAHRATQSPLKITLMTGASLGHGIDGSLADANALSRRLPFQSDPKLRKKINSGEVLFVDQHLGETADLLANGFLAPVDIAVLEVTKVLENGHVIPTTSVGNNLAYAQHAKHIILEVNVTIPEAIRGFHDIFHTGHSPQRAIIPIMEASSIIGTDVMPIDPNKVIGIVFSDAQDSPAELVPPDEKTTAIAGHLLEFFKEEIKKGRMTKSLHPLQAGIGKVANAVLSGFVNGDFENLTMYSEVLQDSTFELIDSGKMTFASACSLAVTNTCYEKFFSNLEKYRGKILLRPQNISNAAEVIRRLGIIAINTAIEFDIYGNVNSTHIAGTKMMNGIGGSGDFSRNSYMSIFVTQAASKNDTISHVVPMASHVDSNEHDVDILVTDFGLADLRGLAPRERAKIIIENCSHPDYRDELRAYYNEALTKGGHTPHVLSKALSWHQKLQDTGSMK